VATAATSFDFDGSRTEQDRVDFLEHFCPEFTADLDGFRLTWERGALQPIEVIPK
jgi:hypothetical protein